MIYPAIILLCTLPSMIDRFTILIGLTKNGYLTLQYLHVAFSQSYGLWNALVYLSNKTIRRRLSACFGLEIEEEFKQSLTSASSIVC